ncbi:MAG: MFS transporter, partial [Lachnospiraceae bacterium]|nr:MFS transporter [Lachnospiraceae bacterium]
KMWLVSAFALLVCWSNGISGAVQNVLLNELHWLKEGTTLLAMWGTTYTAGQLFGALLVVLFAGFTEYVPGRNRGVWSSRNSFIGNWAHPICNGIAFVIGLTGISFTMSWRVQYMIPSVLSIIASLIMDKIPRRIMGVALLVLMAVLGIFTGQQTTMTMLIISTFLLNTVIYMYVCYASAVYVPEMWPTSAKMSGSGFCNAMGRVSNIFFPFLVTYVASSIGSSGVFVLISIVAAIIAVSILVFGVETRGESVEDIGNVD